MHLEPAAVVLLEQRGAEDGDRMSAEIWRDVADSEPAGGSLL
jgi:hypothetical protein